MPQKTSVLLGHLAQRAYRGRYHRRRVTLLLSKLAEYAPKRGSIVPKIFVEEELATTDKITVEGENGFNDEMQKYISTEFPDAQVEHSDGKVDIYLPVKEEGIITNSLYVDLFSNLSVVIVCLFLLYLFMYQ
jgi:hypothetical protein